MFMSSGFDECGGARSEIGKIAETVGINFFSFLSVQELVSLSFCSKQLYTETRKHAFNVMLQQLPLSSDEDSDSNSTDTLSVYSGGPSTNSKEAFIEETIEFLQVNEVYIECDTKIDPIEVLKQNSFVKIVSSDGSTSHFSVGFKHRVSFQSRSLGLVHAQRFLDEASSKSDQSEERQLTKQWVYFLTSLSHISVSTWHTMFLFGQKFPVGGAGMIFTNQHTGEIIQVVRRMSKKKEPDTLEELVERVRSAVFSEDDPAFLAVQELQTMFAALTSD